MRHGDLTNEEVQKALSTHYNLKMINMFALMLDVTREELDKQLKGTIVAMRIQQFGHDEPEPEEQAVDEPMQTNAEAEEEEGK